MTKKVQKNRLLRFHRKLGAFLVVAAASVCVCSGCGQSSDPSVAQWERASGPVHTAEDTVLNFGCQMYSDGLLNSIYDENAGWNVMRYGIGEALFKFNDNMEVEPWLAESYTVNEEHTEWVIRLSEGVRFSNGSVLTPTKVKAYFDYLKEAGPEGSAYPEKYLEYEAEIIADDEANTLTIRTTQPYVNLPGQLAHPTMAIIDIEHTSDPDRAPVGTGPYMVEAFLGTGVGYELVKNPYYRQDVPYDYVHLMYMSDSSAKSMALQSGQVDLVENITNVFDLESFTNSEEFTVDTATGVRCGFVWMNFDGILGNDTLRKAILMSIDGDAICNSRTIGNLYTSGYSVLPSNLSYRYEELLNPYEYDPEAAKAMLDAAGIIDTDGDGIREIDGQNIELRYVSYESRLLNDLSDAHIQYLYAIGIDCIADYGTSDLQWSKLTTGNYDLNNNNWTTVATGDPLVYLANWASDSTHCGYSNAEYDQLYEELKQEMEPEQRKTIILRMQQILLDDAVVLIDGYYNSSIVYSDKVAEAYSHTADYYWLTTEIVPAQEASEGETIE